MVEMLLRESRESDLETFFSQEHDPEANRLARFPARARGHFFAHWRQRALGDPHTMVRTVLADDAIAGNIVCWDAAGKRMVGYWFGREFWGRGIGTAAVRAFVAEAPWRPLHADPHIGNTGSVRLLEKVGFRRDRVEQYPALDADGEVDHVILVLD